jgi:protein-ribulosamine 3-kinase
LLSCSLISSLFCSVVAGLFKPVKDEYSRRGWYIHERRHSQNDSAKVDSNIAKQFPQGTELISAIPFGKSEWTSPAQLHVRFPDASERYFFLKPISGSHARTLAEGEYNAMSELYRWTPDLVPKSHSWGKYKVEKTAAYFFLSEFLVMNMGLPDPDRLCQKLARFHKESVSPNGQYGFRVTTCQGQISQAVAWETEWTTFFIKLLEHVIELDIQTNGEWAGLYKVEMRLITKVIPRLLGALTQEGRTMKPSLIHSDLWEGNIGTSLDGEIYIFDSAAFYAHHEMEVAY